MMVKVSNNLTFGYGKSNLFSLEGNDDLIFEKGKIYGIFGDNGSGKTTFLNILNGLLKPASGSVTYSFNNSSYILPQDSKLLPAIISNNIRRSFQVPFLCDELTVYEHLILTERNYKYETTFKSFLLPKKTIPNNIVISLLNTFQFPFYSKVNTLSYGQRRIASNFQLICSNASLLIMDEPFANLSDEMINSLKGEYLRLKKQNKTTIILVEHRSENLINFSDVKIMIKEHKISKVN